MKTATLPTENRIIRDWVSFTVRGFGSPWEVIDAIGMSACTWSESPKGAHGYQNKLYFESVNVHYNGRDDMGIWVEMSGKGCRAFETHSSMSWDALFDWMADVGANLTRLDVAYDDFAGKVPIERFCADIEAGRYVSKFGYWETVRSAKGLSAYVGSPQSSIRVRVYDKAAETGLKTVPYDRELVRRAETRAELQIDETEQFDEKEGNQPHWVRVELQMRDARAQKFVDLTHGEGLCIGDAFAGVLLNYVRVVVPSCDDSNRSRWQMARYWKNLVGDVERISVYEAPGQSMDLGRVKEFVIDRAGNAVDCLISCVGRDAFFDLLKGRSCKPNPKYQIIVDDFWRESENLMNRVGALMGLDEGDVV